MVRVFILSLLNEYNLQVSWEYFPKRNYTYQNTLLPLLDTTVFHHSIRLSRLKQNRTFLEENLISFKFKRNRHFPTYQTEVRKTNNITKADACLRVCCLCNCCEDKGTWGNNDLKILVGSAYLKKKVHAAWISETTDT